MCYLKYTTFLKVNSFCDLCAIDYPWNMCRFELIYNLWSLRYNIRYFILFYLQNFQMLFSGITYYSNLNWVEREIWDLFGIFSKNNFDLRRILTDYGFTGYPLRKDFPLSGYIELVYSDISNTIIYNNLELMQDFRIFQFSSPWEILKTSYTVTI